MTLIKTAPARRFVATVAAAATALALMTAGAMPARASTETDNFAKAIAALAAIAIIGSAINDSNRKNKAVAPQPRRDSDRYDRDGRYNRDNRHDRRQQARILPQECAVEVRSRRRSQTLYVGRCLNRNGVTRQLPQQCATQVYLRNRPVTAYDEACLRDAGFRTEGPRRRRD